MNAQTIALSLSEGAEVLTRVQRECCDDGTCGQCTATELCSGPMPEQITPRHCVPMTADDAEEQLSRSERGRYVAELLPEFMLALRGLDKRNQEAVRTLLKGGLGL